MVKSSFRKSVCLPLGSSAHPEPLGSHDLGLGAPARTALPPRSPVPTACLSRHPGEAGLLAGGTFDSLADHVAAGWTSLVGVSLSPLCRQLTLV